MSTCSSTMAALGRQYSGSPVIHPSWNSPAPSSSMHHAPPEPHAPHFSMGKRSSPTCTAVLPGPPCPQGLPGCRGPATAGPPPGGCSRAAHRPSSGCPCAARDAHVLCACALPVDPACCSVPDSRCSGACVVSDRGGGAAPTYNVAAVWAGMRRCQRPGMQAKGPTATSPGIPSPRHPHLSLLPVSSRPEGRGTMHLTPGARGLGLTSWASACMSADPSPRAPAAPPPSAPPGPAGPAPAPAAPPGPVPCAAAASGAVPAQPKVHTGGWSAPGRSGLWLLGAPACAPANAMSSWLKQRMTCAWVREDDGPCVHT